MALVRAYAETNPIRREAEDVGDGNAVEGGELTARFFGYLDNCNKPVLDPDSPQASLQRRDPGRATSVHFHKCDQFQIVVEGKAKLARHDLTPYCVHFARAYTPYGPLVEDAVTGSTMFVLRAHTYGNRAQRLPDELDQLRQVPNRRSLQIHRPATFPAFESGAAATDIMLQAVPGIKDENGLAAYTLIMKPNAQAHAPDPSYGDGQYLIVLKGSLWHDNKERTAPALVFVYPKEGPFPIYAGAAGLEALILNFPRPQTGASPTAKSVQAATGFRIWKCTLCEFVYDEAAGLPEEGIAPGTRWQDVPETWSCPDCSSSKGDFQMVEL